MTDRSSSVRVVVKPPTSEQDARARILRTAVNLYWRQGLSNTGVQQILTASAAPRGSLYFHFPGGKEELAVAALTVAGQTVSQSLARSLAEHRDTGEATSAFVLAFAELLVSSGYELGCPLATATLEAANTSEPIREVTTATFVRWRDLIAEHLEGNGYPVRDARQLAQFAISSIEGALILARAARSDEPLVTVASVLSQLLKGTGSPAASPTGAPG